MAGIESAPSQYQTQRQLIFQWFRTNFIEIRIEWVMIFAPKIGTKRLCRKCQLFCSQEGQHLNSFLPTGSGKLGPTLFYKKLHSRLNHGIHNSSYLFTYDYQWIASWIYVSNQFIFVRYRKILSKGMNEKWGNVYSYVDIICLIRSQYVNHIYTLICFIFAGSYWKLISYTKFYNKLNVLLSIDFILR